MTPLRQLPTTASPNLKNDTAIRLLIAGPWLLYTVDRLVWLSELSEVHFEFASGLVACAFGVVAGVSAIARLDQTRALALLASAVFFAIYIANVLLWATETKDLNPEVFGSSFLERVWSYYRLAYISFIFGFRGDGLAWSIAFGFLFVFRLAIMPIVQIAIFVLLLVTRRKQPFNPKPGRQVD